MFFGLLIVVICIIAILCWIFREKIATFLNKVKQFFVSKIITFYRWMKRTFLKLCKRGEL